MRRRWVAALWFVLLLFVVLPVAAQDNVHVVQPGENLFRIALRYGVSVDALAQTNDIVNSWQIYVGQSLTIPSAAAPVVSAPIENIPVVPTAPTYHTVQRGENLAAVARRYGMTPEALASLNNIANPNLIYVGQQLMVSQPTAIPTPTTAPLPTVVPTAQVVVEAPTAAPVTQTNVTHVVQPGEHLASIARQYNVSWLAIAQANNIYNTNHIVAGQSLTIPTFVSSDTDLGIVNVVAAPPPTKAEGREIIVDLSDSRVYAYENGVLVRNVLASMGLPWTPTVQGSFTVQRRYVAQTMSGPGYYLPDVPYILYFYQGYALHGTYWHDNFGQPMSHGCVNLPTPEAEWFYNWADVGTPVLVQA